MQNIKSLVFIVSLLLITVVVAAYTFITISQFGPNFLIPALQNLNSLNWSGQFTLDFSAYLFLSAVWVFWRNHHRTNAAILALCAGIFGILFFAPYLIYLLFTEKGDVTKVLVGKRK